MTPRVTLAVTARVLTQLRRDHRTLALLLVMPCLLMTLLAWIFADSHSGVFDRVAPGLLALFPFIVMFLVTSVTTLRERTGGTLERLLAMPMGRLDLILGYALAFGVVACVQAALAVALSVGALGLNIAGSVWLLGAIAVLDAVLGTALGLFVSAFARTEFQAVQFLPALVIPQMLLCGLLVARDQLPRALELVSDVLPLSYAVDAMTAVSTGDATWDIASDIGVVAAFVVGFVALGALTLRRRTP
ncbi:MAG TPA: ABC transporter permease [Dermacoccus sp.]|mgnify:CR=1 FL=1|uniref:ABC transporter permease n=1 Tax=Dermacoccus TaxID=57495 RepID=UPI0007852EE2|nr:MULTISPECIES: ABC transporter permease [Dermacoccus]MCT1603190.1 ABC transporter permease [Dermacoccus nishinomiyaensis]HCQ18263.1 ABC transporter permease [Dermacoccus sp.]